MSQQPKRSGRGTHGSLTKAGKVREQVWADKGLTHTSIADYYKEKRAKRRKTNPRTENRRLYKMALASGRIKPLPLATRYPPREVPRKNRNRRPSGNRRRRGQNPKARR